MQAVKRTIIAVIGFIFVALGLIFILLPGPAIIFIPLGLAILSLEFAWARIWLRKSQRMMRKSAEQLDKWWRDYKFRRK